MYNFIISFLRGFKAKAARVLRSNLFKSGGVYTLTTVITKAIPFLLLPVLTRYLTTEDYGILSMFTVLVSITVPIAGLATDTSIFRYFYKDNIHFAKFITNGLVIVLCGVSFITGIYYFFPNLISYYTHIPKNWLFAVIVVALCQIIIRIVTNIWIAQDKPIQFGLFRILLTVMNVGLVIFLVVELGFNWKGKVVGQLMVISLMAIIGILILWRSNLVHFEFDLSYIKKSLLYSTPLVFGILSSFILTMSDRIFITNMVGISETGLYSVGYKVGMIIGILAGSLGKAWTPWLFTQLKKGEVGRMKKLVKITYLLMVGYLLLAAILYFIAPWLMKVMVGEEFYGAIHYIGWIAFGYAFSGMQGLIDRYILYVEKTIWISLKTIFCALLNLCLNYILISRNGAIGAAQATTITLFIAFMMSWTISIRLYKMPWLYFLNSKNTT